MFRGTCSRVGYEMEVFAGRGQNSTAPHGSRAGAHWGPAPFSTAVYWELWARGNRLSETPKHPEEPTEPRSEPNSLPVHSSRLTLGGRVQKHVQSHAAPRQMLRRDEADLPSPSIWGILFQASVISRQF
jgi:hypothetical protein